MTTTDETNGGQVVRYSVKELLQEIRDDVKGMASKLDSKADKSELVHALGRVEVLEDAQRAARVRDEQRAQDSQRGTERSRYRVPIIITVANMFLSPLWFFALGHVFK